MATANQSQFEDLLPVMADKLGGDGLIEVLCNRFQLLMDTDKDMITFNSLKKKSSLLGLGDLSDVDIASMLREGDFDGDACLIMFRVCPNLMDQSEFLLEETLEQEYNDF